jgi:hypothetical protein
MVLNDGGKYFILGIPNPRAIIKKNMNEEK